MANLIQCINKTKTIDAKCEIIIDKILLQYKNGIIKTESEMLYLLKQALKDFYYSIGKPIYKFNAAKGTPISDHFNSMVEDAFNDMSIIIQDCNNISEAIQSSFVDIELGRKMMNNKIRYIFKKIDDIENKIVVNNNSNIINFTDSFVNLDYIEGNTSKIVNQASIDTTCGVLTLYVEDKKEFSKNCNVEILQESNGFPGNTHAIDVLDGEPHFIGENNLHMDLDEVIDNNIDTWLEYEAFNIDDKIIEECNSFGFNFKEGVSWILEDDTLKLSLKITMGSPSVCNWLSLTPFISENKGAEPSSITSVTISDGDSTVQHLNTVLQFDNDTVILFVPQVVSYIIINFEQKIPYELNIGHTYFTKANSSNILIFDEFQNTLYSRVDGPNVSVELLGMKYDPNTKKCIQPKNYTVDDNNVYIDSRLIKKQLFTLPPSTDKIKSNREIIAAYRYFIGIKNISISNYKFSDTSVYVSKPFNTKESIKSITLESDEMILKEFDDLIEDDNGVKTEDAIKYGWGKGQWIKYAITLNNGNTWIDIYPKHRSFQGPCTIKINSDIPSYQRNTKNIIYIDPLIEPTSVKIKITLQRPTGDIYKTPVVYQYRLNTLTGDENIEY